MEDAWEMVDEFDRLYNGGEIADELKVVIELRTALSFPFSSYFLLLSLSC